MQDLDLDELDQAVTQLMDKPRVKKPVKKSAPENLVVQKPQPAPHKPETVEPKAAESVTVTTPVARPLAKPAPRKRMRPGAMDIIQRPAAAPAPSRRPAREAVAIQPTAAVVPEPPQPRAATNATPPAEEVSDDLLASLNLLEDSNKTEKSESEAPPTPAADSWPDPIDLHDFNDAPEQKESQPEPPEPAPTIQSAPPALAEPAASPFVTTKVEKRPLGAYAAHTGELDPQAPEEPSPSPEHPPKAELAAASPHESLSMPQPQDEPESDDLRHAAIPQQYHTAQPVPHNTVHDMFDTKEYHAPPQPMHTTRRSGLGVAIGIIVLIVLVVAVAAVGYLMSTGMLDIRKIW